MRSTPLNKASIVCKREIAREIKMMILRNMNKFDGMHDGNFFDGSDALRFWRECATCDERCFAKKQDKNQYSGSIPRNACVACET